MTLCALPLLRPHFDIAKHCAKSARLLRENLAADQIFERVRLMFFEGEITWKELDRGKPVHVGKAVVAQKERAGNLRLVNVNVTFGKRKYHYELYIEKVRTAA